MNSDATRFKCSPSKVLGVTRCKEVPVLTIQYAQTMTKGSLEGWKLDNIYLKSAPVS
jgi:hypothetical protein